MTLLSILLVQYHQFARLTLDGHGSGTGAVSTRRLKHCLPPERLAQWNTSIEGGRFEGVGAVIATNWLTKMTGGSATNEIERCTSRERD